MEGYLMVAFCFCTCYNIFQKGKECENYMSFISYLINGISLGSVYAIIALGYTMVYGIAKMLNFAHGDVIMIGAYVVLTVITGAWAGELSVEKVHQLLKTERKNSTKEE